MCNPKINVLPEPTNCHVCNSTGVQFISNEFMFKTAKGKWPYVWVCKDCGAMVGTHENTRIPLGCMADAETRKARSRAHKVFDKIWYRLNLVSRTHAYMSLSRAMGSNFQDTHIGLMDKEQCEFVITWSKEFIKGIQQDNKRKSLYLKGKKTTVRGKK